MVFDNLNKIVDYFSCFSLLHEDIFNSSSRCARCDVNTLDSVNKLCNKRKRLRFRHRLFRFSFELSSSNREPIQKSDSTFIFLVRRPPRLNHLLIEFGFGLCANALTN